MRRPQRRSSVHGVRRPGRINQVAETTSDQPIVAAATCAKVIHTKEEADHSLPYLLAAALLDGDVMPAQFKPERIHQGRRAAAAEEGFGPAEPGARFPSVHVGDSVEKFDRLVAGHADEGLVPGDQGCRAFGRKHPGQGPDETARARQGRLARDW